MELSDRFYIDSTGTLRYGFYKENIYAGQRIEDTLEYFTRTI